MTHPTPTGPSQPPPPPRPGVAADAVLDEADRILAGPLPRLGEVIRDAERYLAQALNVLGRQYDPESAPDDKPLGVKLSLAVAESSVRAALGALGHLAALSLPPVGSAAEFPARQDPTSAPEVDGPDLTTRGLSGEEPTPGSAAVVAPAARESVGGFAALGAGVSSGPSPRRDDDTPPGNDVRRGAGPGYLGPAVKFRVAKCGQLSVHGPHDVEHGPDQPRSCPGVRVP